MPGLLNLNYLIVPATPATPAPIVDNSWIVREHSRMDERTHPVWTYETWWIERSDTLRLHFVHASATDEKLIAYTQDADKGRRDIQTPVKPGRYLSRYFSDVLTPKQIAFFAAWQSTGSKPSAYADAKAWPMEIATTQEAIIDVYENGPQSCMRGMDCVRVYAAGDLAVAYLIKANSDDEKVWARALIWPERKVIGRIYPTDYCWQRDGFDNQEESENCARALMERLRADGYRSEREDSGASFNGARLLKIEADDGDDNKYVMPYLDHSYGVDDHGDYFRMSDRSPEFQCDDTGGTISTEPEYPYFCENCEEGCHDINTVYTRYHSRHNRREQGWCEHCAENYAFYCEGTQDTYSQDVGYARLNDGNTYCIAWLEDNAFLSDYSGEWFLHDEDDAVEMEDGETWSASEFAHYGYVDDDGCNQRKPRTPSPTIHDPAQSEASI